MQKIIKILTPTILFFILGVFFIGLSKNNNYSTDSLIGKKIPNVSIEYFEGNKFYKISDLKKNNLRCGYFGKKKLFNKNNCVICNNCVNHYYWFVYC